MARYYHELPLYLRTRYFELPDEAMTDTPPLSQFQVEDLDDLITSPSTDDPDARPGYTLWHSSGHPYFVTQDGHYKVGVFGTVKRAVHGGCIRVTNPPREVSMSRVLASTFVPIPDGCLFPPARAHVVTSSPHHVPGYLHAKALSWTKARRSDGDTHQGRMLSPVQKPLEGEMWERHEGYDVHVSSHNRYRVCDSQDYIEFVPRPDAPKGSYYQLPTPQGMVPFHRIVAEAFMGPPPDDKPVVDHRDGNTLNNHPFNLRYASYSENAQNRGARRTNDVLDVEHDWHQAVCFPLPSPAD